MPFTLRPYRLLLALTNTVCILVLYLSTLVQAETKMIVSKSTYSWETRKHPHSPRRRPASKRGGSTIISAAHIAHSAT